MLRRDFIRAVSLAVVADVVQAVPYYQHKYFINGLGYARWPTAQTDLTAFGVTETTVYYPNDIWSGGPTYNDDLALPTESEWQTAAALCNTDTVIFDIEHYTTASKLISFYNQARQYFPGKSIVGYQCGLNGFAGMVRTTSPYGNPSSPFTLFQNDNNTSAQFYESSDFVVPVFYCSKPNATLSDIETFAVALRDEAERLGVTGKPIVPFVWRQYVNSASVGDNSKSIVNISQEDPCVVTISSEFSGDNSCETGDVVVCDSVGGMTELRNLFARCIKVDSTNYQLAGVDSSGFTAYTSGGTFRKLPTDALWKNILQVCIEYFDGFIVWNNAREWPSGGNFPYTSMPGFWDVVNAINRPAPYGYTLKPSKRVRRSP